MTTPRAAARICLIRQGFYPLDARVRREVGALVLDGHEVEVICLRLPGQPRFERRDQVTVHRLPITRRRAGRINYLIEYGAFLAASAVLVAAIHLRRPFDVIQVNTMPDSLVFAAVVPRLLGARVLLDLHECMPEFYAVKFRVRTDHPAVRLLCGMEQAAIRFATRAITCTEQMRQAFASRGAPKDKIDVILNSANEEEFDPRRYSPPRRNAGEFKLICHGTVERIYGVDTVVRAVAQLRSEIPGLRLDIYGDGSALNEIRSLIRDLDISDRVHVAGTFVPIDELVQAISRANAGVVAMRRDIFRDLTHCNKMFDLITMRKPAIVSRTRSVEEYFDDSCFQMFIGGDDQDLARAIREIHADRRLQERLVRNAARANEPYRWPHQRKRYQDIVRALIAGAADSLAAARMEVEPMVEIST